MVRCRPTRVWTIPNSPHCRLALLLHKLKRIRPSDETAAKSAVSVVRRTLSINHPVSQQGRYRNIPHTLHHTHTHRRSRVPTNRRNRRVASNPDRHQPSTIPRPHMHQCKTRRNSTARAKRHLKTMPTTAMVEFLCPHRTSSGILKHQKRGGLRVQEGFRDSTSKRRTVSRGYSERWTRQHCAFSAYVRVGPKNVYFLNPAKPPRGLARNVDPTRQSTRARIRHATT